MSEETAPSAPAAGEPAAAADTGSGEIVVAFISPFFAKMSMAYFRLAENSDEPVLVVEYGEQTVALPIKGVRRELDLPDDHPDAKMLNLVVKGLKYVNTIAIGDPLPSEITSGKASWTLTPQHAQIAYQRLALKLMTWMTGGKVETASASSVAAVGDDILKQAQDPEVRKKIASAFGEAAEALGLGRDRREDVVGYLETLAQELGYIEALRERFGRIVRVGRRLAELHAQGKKGQRISDVVEQAARLIRPAVDQFVQLFKETDALTNDIMAVLKDLDGHIAAIRERRDDIHQRLNPWDDLLDAWEKVKETEISSALVDVAGRTVRMLAPRFMPAKEWALRYKEEKAKAARVKSWRSPEMQREELNKVAGRIMRW